MHHPIKETGSYGIAVENHLVQAHEKNCLTPELDESSDSGHASTGTPGDPFLNLKTDVNEVSVPSLLGRAKFISVFLW